MQAVMPNTAAVSNTLVPAGDPLDSQAPCETVWRRLFYAFRLLFPHIGKSFKDGGRIRDLSL